MRERDDLFAPYATLNDLMSLPWPTAKRLALSVAMTYRWKPSQGLWLLLVLLCRLPLRWLIHRYPAAIPDDLALYLIEGIQRGKSPWDYAHRVLRGEVKHSQDDAEALEELAEETTLDSASPVERLLAVEILERLDPETKRVLLDAAVYPIETCAVRWGVPKKTAQTWVWRAQQALKKLF